MKAFCERSPLKRLNKILEKYLFKVIFFKKIFLVNHWTMFSGLSDNDNNKDHDDDDDDDDDDANSKDVEVVEIGRGEALTKLDRLVYMKDLSEE